MGDKDTITKNYTRDNRIFADIVNLALYGGRHVVKPENVTELDTAELQMFFSAEPVKRRPEAVQKYRDVLKKVTVENETFVTRIIVGVENQSSTHYAMPVRGMLYDALNYANQVATLTKAHKENAEKLTPAEFLSGLKKEDRLIPVKTIAVSYDVDAWDGPLSLHEMLNWDGIPDSVKEMVADYSITLIQPCDLDDELLSELQSSFGNTMGFIKYSRDAEKLGDFISKNEEQFRHFPSDALAVVDAFCRLDFLDMEEYEEEGDCDMCKALQDIREIERSEGRAEGITQGITQGIAQGQVSALGSLVLSGMISLEDALTVSGLTEEEFINQATQLNIMINLDSRKK